LVSGAGEAAVCAWAKLTTDNANDKAATGTCNFNAEAPEVSVGMAANWNQQVVQERPYRPE
jgi:hypothetical protein